VSRADRSKYRAKEREQAREKYANNPEKFIALSQEYYVKNRDKVRAGVVRRRAENPSKYLVGMAKYRAKKAGLVFSITSRDIDIPKFCPVLGIELGPVGGGNRSNSPSIDRIDNSKGYIPGNVLVVSHRANCLKRDATLLEMQRIADFYTRLSRRNSIDNE
jgi:hypothetical protein